MRDISNHKRDRFLRRRRRRWLCQVDEQTLDIHFLAIFFDQHRIDLRCGQCNDEQDTIL